MAGKFELKTAKSGQFHFHLLAGNGQIIMQSEMYESKASALNRIASIQKNKRAIVKEIRPDIESTDLQLIANTALDFRACKGFVDILDENNVAIPAHCAELLECKIGDFIRFIPIKL